MPRFVILYHEFPLGSDRASHWDLMVQQEDKLLTWELSTQPEPGKPTSARKLADHRIEYLDYEGPVSDQRGVVTQFIAGNCTIVSEPDLAFAAQLSSPDLNCFLRISEDSDDNLLTATFESID